MSVGKGLMLGEEDIASVRDKYNNFIDSLETPLDGKPFDRIVDIEDFVRRALGGSLGNDVVDEELKKAGFGGVGFLIDVYHERVCEALDEAVISSDGDVEKYFGMLGIDCERVENLIEASLLDKKSVDGGEDGFSTKDRSGKSKVNVLIKELVDQDISFETLKVYVRSTYVPSDGSDEIYLLIPKLNKTVIVNTTSGYYTYVVSGLKNLEEISRIPRNRMVEDLGVIPVKSSNGNLDVYRKNLADILGFESKVEGDVEGLDRLKKELAVAMKQKYPDPQVLIDLSFADRVGVKVLGIGLHHLAAIFFGTRKLRPHAKIYDFAKFLFAIYGEGYPWIDHELMTKEEVIDVIKKEYPTPESFVAFVDSDQFLTAKIDGMGVHFLYKKIWGVTGRIDLKTREGRMKLARAIYGEGHDCIDESFLGREEWIKMVKEKYPEAEGFVKLAMSSAKFSQADVEGKNFDFLYKKIFGVAHRGKLLNRKGRMGMAKAIYGEGHDCIDCEFWDFEQWAEVIREKYPKPSDFIKGSNGVSGRFLFRTWRLIIGHIIGVKDFDVRDRDKVVDFALRVYGSGYPDLDCLLWKKDELSERWSEVLKNEYPTKEDFLSTSNADIQNFHHGSFRIRYIFARILGRGLDASVWVNKPLIREVADIVYEGKDG
jgi:hypothetical protein